MLGALFAIPTTMDLPDRHVVATVVVHEHTAAKSLWSKLLCPQTARMRRKKTHQQFSPQDPRRQPQQSLYGLFELVFVQPGTAVNGTVSLGRRCVTELIFREPREPKGGVGRLNTPIQPSMAIRDHHDEKFPYFLLLGSGSPSPTSDMSTAPGWIFLFTWCSGTPQCRNVSVPSRHTDGKIAFVQLQYETDRCTAV